MKKTLLLLILSFPLMCFSQDTTKLSVNKVYEDVKQGFHKLVNSLEGPAKHTYEVYVKQKYFEGVVNTVVFLIIIGTLTVLTVLAYKRGKWEDDVPANAWGVMQVIMPIALTIMTGIFVCYASDFISKIFNPEYHAIAEIIETLYPSKK